jgi:hypothetical protein
LIVNEQLEMERHLLLLLLWIGFEIEYLSQYPTKSGDFATGR